MKRKIRVMQLLWRFNTGGAEKMVLQIMRAFQEDEQTDLRTLVFYPANNDMYAQEAIEEGLNVVFMDKTPWDKYPFPINKAVRYFVGKNYKRSWLKKEIEIFQPDVIHIHLAFLANDLYDVLKEHADKIKVYYHLHSMPEAIPEEQRKNIRLAVKNKVYYPICVTEQQKNSAKHIYGVSDDTPIIYNGFKQEQFLNYSNPLNEELFLREELGINKSDFIVGSVGRGTSIKNFEKLADSVAIISRCIENVRLVIVGEIPITMRDDLLKRAGKGNVIFTGIRSDVKKIYQLFDVFALASFYESSSIVSVEAQLSGIPCVLSSSITDEVVISDGVKMISPKDSSEVWASTILSQRNRKIEVINLSRFDIQSNMERLKKCYLDLNR